MNRRSPLTSGTRFGYLLAFTALLLACLYAVGVWLIALIP